MMTLKQVADSIGELFEHRTDLQDESIHSKLLMAAIQIAQQTNLIQREFEIPLQDCVSHYLLENCDQVDILYVDKICWDSGLIGCSKKCYDEFKLVQNIGCEMRAATKPCGSVGCSLDCYGSRSIRFVPPDVVEVSPSKGLSGTITLTATVAPKYNACEIDDDFLKHHRLPLLYGTLAFMYEAGGEMRSEQLVIKYRSMFANEISRHYLRKNLGGHRQSHKLKAPRFV
jgi:hypothetical protein